MRKGTFFAVALAAALLALDAGHLAAEVDLDGSPALEVRVINNNALRVQVYVEDAKGRLHRLGVVGVEEVRTLEVPARITEMGELQVKVFTDSPGWSSASEDFGVRTRSLDPNSVALIQFWVEPNLERSQVELLRS